MVHFKKQFEYKYAMPFGNLGIFKLNNQTLKYLENLENEKLAMLLQAGKRQANVKFHLNLVATML